MGDLPVIGQPVGIPVDTDGPVCAVFAVHIDVFKLIIIQGSHRNVSVCKAVAAASGLGVCGGDELVV